MLTIVAAGAGLVLAGLAGQAGGATYYVDPNGSADFNSIQAAIDDPCTVDGDEIEVAPGTYYEDVNFSGKGVRLYSSGGAGVTTIDANGADHAVQCVSGEDANTILAGFTITGGYADGSYPDDCGGGMYNDGSSPTVTNCIFIGNEAYSGGGGMENYNYSSPTVTNCIFSDNWANTGGGLENIDNSNPIVTNCTFSKNFASSNGEGMSNDGTSSPTVTNCIFWGKVFSMADQIYPVSGLDVSYSDVQGGYTGTGNIDADPRFVDESNPDANLRDFRLRSPGSPCVDTGDNSALPPDTADLDGDGNTAEPIPFDLDGVPRVVDGNDDGSAVVDMGAYEREFTGVQNITQDTWYKTIQAAINDANDGDDIEVAAGTYYEDVNFSGKGARLYSSGGRDVTTIDANGAYHAVKCVSGEDANTILEGFTITGGNANGPVDSDQRGGGMYNSGSSPTVTNCIFSGNSADFKGGGMSNYYSSPTVTNCIFSGNSASSKGGGMYNEKSNLTVNNCSFIGNSGYEGGGMHTDWWNPTVANCTFSGNVATYGGGMNNNVSSPLVTNCTFRGNSADYGGGMYNNNDIGIPTVTNCTFSGNSAIVDGGGMYLSLIHISEPTRPY